MNSIWVNQSLGIDPATGNEIFKARMATSCRSGQQPIMSLWLVRIRIGRTFGTEILRGKRPCPTEHDFSVSNGGTNV